jgi:NADH-quinone oxidoreductase subunit D
MPLTRTSLSENLAHDEPQEYLWTMNFGPQHPATHTTLRLILKLDGERVVEAIPDIGYLHSGFEKLGESLDYNQYVTGTDRMNYISPMANNVAWHLAVEKLLGIDVPPRCQYLRVIVAELARISDHLVCNGAATGPQGWTLGLSPTSSTPSTPASRSTTSSRLSAGPASPTAIRAWAG